MKFSHILKILDLYPHIIKRQTHMSITPHKIKTNQSNIDT